MEQLLYIQDMSTNLLKHLTGMDWKDYIFLLTEITLMNLSSLLTVFPPVLRKDWHQKCLSSQQRHYCPICFLLCAGNWLAYFHVTGIGC